MKITLSRNEVLKVLEIEDINDDIRRAIGKPVEKNSIKDTMQIMYNLYDTFKETNRIQHAIKFNINFKSRDNFLWIEINPIFMIDYLELYYSYVKEIISPTIAIFKATRKLIEKQKQLVENYNNNF